VSLCRECPLNQLPYDPKASVPGVGSPTARVFVIGEAPGEKESQTGMPFVGPAGQLLQELMSDAGYTFDDVFVTNTVKHRPPANRVPTSLERTACSGFLSAQLQAVDPKVILAVGKSAAKALAELSGIDIPDKGLRGYTFNLTLSGNSWPVICTWHPAYILRNQNSPAKAELLSDLKAALAFTEAIDGNQSHIQDNPS
jgi:DNA polymerase